MTDLTPLHQDAVVRAARLTGRVMRRVSEARLRDGVRRRLARLLVPSALAAAAALAWVMASGRTPRPEPAEVAGVTRWVVLGQRPDIGELVAIAGRAP